MTIKWPRYFISVFVHGLLTGGANCLRFFLECYHRLLSRDDRFYIKSRFSQKNADKTLKCPKCNWHYKYIETLEAHIRDKHGDDPINTGNGPMLVRLNIFSKTSVDYMLHPVMFPGISPNISLTFPI